MDSEKDVKNELKEIAPDFPLQQKHYPPEGYFEHLPGQILYKWKSEQVKPTGLSLQWLRISTVAAAIAILLIGGWLISKEQTNDHIMAITTEEAYQYVHENIQEFETLLEGIDVNLDDNGFNIPEEDIRQYLMEEIDGEETEELF